MSLVTCNAKGETVVHKAAFRCKNCGHLTPPTHAGENLLPHSCPNCKAGVSFGIDPSARSRFDDIIKELSSINTSPIDRERLARELADLPREKLYHPDNWEVLDDCTDERLEELGLEAEHVCCHKPAKITKPSQGRVVKVEAEDDPKAKDGSNAKVG